jgi:hypothetical protein
MVRLIVPSLLIVGFACPLLVAAPAPRSGSSFERQLTAPLTAKWNHVSFRRAIKSLGDTQNIAIVIDRRMDADKPFALAVTGDSLELTLARIAESEQIGCSIFPPVVFFGPKSACERLQTVAALRREEIGRLPAGPRRLMSQSRPGGWPILGEPAKLVENLAAEARVTIKNPEIIPHDLWDEARLPPMPWSDRLTLILAQFDLTFEVGPDGRSIELKPIPNDVTITRKYAGGDSPSTRRAKLRKLVPGVQIEMDGGQLVVRGRLEEHREIASLLSGKQVRTKTVTRGDQRYTLKVAGLPLENVFAQLGKMLKLEIQYDREAIDKAGISLKQLISFEVTKATLEELLSAALQDTGLKYELTGTTVTMRPVKK